MEMYSVCVVCVSEVGDLARAVDYLVFSDVLSMRVVGGSRAEEGDTVVVSGHGILLKKSPFYMMLGFV